MWRMAGALRVKRKVREQGSIQGLHHQSSKRATCDRDLCLPCWWNELSELTSLDVVFDNVV